jgi:type I restriction enzyme S subunit
VAPPPVLVDAYERLMSAIDNRIGNVGAQSRTLAALHDTLLPKLISGELRVTDAERLVETRT